MNEGSVLAVRAAQAIVEEARAAERAAERHAPTATVVRMERPSDPPPLYVALPRRRTGLFVALGLIALTLGCGILGR